jgi:hypothetical protein
MTLSKYYLKLNNGVSSSNLNNSLWKNGPAFRSSICLHYMGYTVVEK